MNTAGHFVKVEEMAKDAGTTITKLCKEAGVARATVDYWRTGKSFPSFRIWNKLETAAAAIKARKEVA